MDNKNIKSKLVAGGLLISVLAYTSPVLAYTKDETVYSKMNSDGENYKTTVSTHLENDENEKLLEDLSSLLNIQNTNGNETYEKDGNKLIWKADGKDIYYQGDTEKQLPITCKIEYTLDGKEISLDDLAGKSGKVAIKITYTNNEKHVVPINGTNTTLYTPFFVMAGTIINNDNNKNITVSNGKVINDGSKTVVVGMAMPGMQESLGISKDTVKLPDSVTITMDATDFELSNIITVATPRILEEEDKDFLDKLDDIYSKVNTLQKSSNQIEEGANTLKEGTTTYYEKSQEFNKAMKQVQQGANSASTKYTELNQGISQLDTSSKTLNNGAKSVNDGATAVQGGLKQVSSSLEELETGSKTISSGAKRLSKGVSIAQNAAKDVTTKVLTAKGTLQVAIQKNEEMLKTLNTGLKSADETQKVAINEKIAIINQENTALKQSLQALETLSIDDTTSNLAILNGSISQVKTGLDGDGTKQNPGLVAGAKTLENGIKKVKNDGVDKLASASSELVTGTKQLYSGTTALKQGTTNLKNGSSQMKNGLSSLNQGTTQLLTANNQLTDGAKTLKTGATELAKGIHTFNTEGITPICNYVNGDLRNLSNRVEKLIQLSEEYQTFTELKDGEKGSVKFIMMTDSIKKKDTEEKAIIPDTPKVESKEKEK